MVRQQDGKCEGTKIGREIVKLRNGGGCVMEKKGPEKIVSVSYSQ